MADTESKSDWKWTGDKEGSEDFDDLAQAEAIYKFGKLGEHLYLQTAPALCAGSFNEYCNLVYEAMVKSGGSKNARYAWEHDEWTHGYVEHC